MDTLRTGVLVLFVLPAPVSCSGGLSLSHPVICYFLDAFLLIYCIVATALLFREKFSDNLSVAAPDNSGDIYQELERPADADPYEVLEQSKRRRKPGKKNRSEPNQDQNRDADPYESLAPSQPPPALPRR